MQKPAAIHITRNPCIRKDSVLKMKAVSGSTAAEAVFVSAIVTDAVTAVRTEKPKNFLI